MKELIQNILVYVVIVSVLRGLITNPKYSQYFQFFSGIIMILIMLSPLLSFFNAETAWYDLLEGNILKMDLAEIEGEIKIADENFQDVVKQEYADTVKNQVTRMADENGIELENVDVVLEEDEGGLTIAEITGKTTNIEEKKSEDLISIETIQIGKEVQSQEVHRQENNSKGVRTLRRQICNQFVLGEDKVHLWK